MTSDFLLFKSVLFGDRGSTGALPGISPFENEEMTLRAFLERFPNDLLSFPGFLPSLFLVAPIARVFAV